MKLKTLIFAGLILPGITLISNAQTPQVNNGSFESWDNLGADTEEPTDWNSFMSASGSLNGNAAQQIKRSTVKRPGSTGTYSCVIWTRSVLGVKANGNLTTGQINMGSIIPSNSNNYNISHFNNPAFSEALGAHPDSLVVWVRTKISNSSHQPRIHAIIHDNYDVRDPIDGNSASHIVAEATLNYTTTGNIWVRKSIPFVYNGPATSPNYILISITTCKDAGTGTAGDSVYADDLQLIYNPVLTTGTISPSSYLVDAINGAPINIPFTLTGTMNAGNIVTAQLSDANGSFASPVTLGTLATTTSGNIAGTIPAGTLTGSGYRVRVVSSNYALTAADNGSNISITLTGTGHTLSGKTVYVGKANTGSPAPNPPTYNAVQYAIDNVIVIMKSVPGGAEIARDTSNSLGVFQFSGVPDGEYKLSYHKYASDTMQTGNDVNAIDVALVKYFIGADNMADPSRNFSAEYKKAINVDNNLAINAVDIARLKAKVGAPYLASKNFPKGNWVAIDTNVIISGADLNISLKTICYGDYNGSSIKYRDSVTNWAAAKMLTKNIVAVSDDYITIGDPSYFEIPLRISNKMKDFSALGLELNYPNHDYRLENVSMHRVDSKNRPSKINPTLDEIIANDNDLLVTDENGVIRIVYATTNHFDVEANDEMITLGFRPIRDINQGILDFSLTGTGVIGDQYGNENEDAYLIMPKIFVQDINHESNFELSAYPNPVNSEATFTYNIPDNGTVRLKAYNTLGKLVSELINEHQENGKHSVNFSLQDLPSGLYTFILEYTGRDKSKCMVLKLVH
ncbi:MAG TPA: T9SS type A sorting domain-containing protein [Bacteroidales bacterium]|nr:T9SS type A sorting domain-containing protein [Bacteroidales bacterium]